MNSKSSLGPQQLRDGEHEGVMDDQAQCSWQEVRAERVGQRTQQEEPGALLLTQFLQELRLLRDPAAQGSRGVYTPLLSEYGGETGRGYAVFYIKLSKFGLFCILQF